MPGTSDTRKLLEAVRDQRVVDPLSDVTRRERKALLGASLVGVALSRGGLIPTEISAFGISVSTVERISLLALLSLALLYFITIFTVYAFTDLKHRDVVLAADSQEAGQVVSDAYERGEKSKTAGGKKGGGKRRSEDLTVLLQNERFQELAALSETAKMATEIRKLGKLRVFFEVHLPVLVGLVAVILIISEIQGLPGSTLVVWTLGTLVAFATIFYIARARKSIQFWFDRSRRAWHKRQMTKVGERMKKAEEGSAARARLEKQLHAHVKGAMAGRWSK